MKGDIKLTDVLILGANRTVASRADFSPGWGNADTDPADASGVRGVRGVTVVLDIAECLSYK